MFEYDKLGLFCLIFHEKYVQDIELPMLTEFVFCILIFLVTKQKM